MVVMNDDFVAKLNKAMYKATMKTALNIQANVVQAETIPMDNGLLQGSGHVETTSIGARLSYSEPYASIQYFNASFSHDKGPHAGTATDHWLDPYLKGGAKHKWVMDRYRANFNKEAEGLL